MKIDRATIASVKKASDGFPDTTVGQKERSLPEFSAAFLIAAYGSLGGDYGKTISIGADVKQKITLLRQYAAGKQPEEPYSRRFALSEGDTSRDGAGRGIPLGRVGGDNMPINMYAKASPAILSVMPPIIGKALRELETRRTIPHVVANDPKSTTERQDFIYQMLAKMRNRKTLPSLYAAAGIEFNADELPMDREQLDLDMEAGTYKEAVVQEMEAIVGTILSQTNWDQDPRMEIAKMDMVPAGAGSVHVMQCADGSINMERVALEDLILPWSSKSDFRDVAFIGRRRQITSDEMMKEAGSQVSDAEVQDLMATSQAYGRPKYISSKKTFEVIDIYFKAPYELNFKHKPGKGYYKIEPENLKPDSEAPEGVERVSAQGLAIYSATWVVGSDVFWNCGPLAAQPAVYPGDPYYPIQVYMPKNYGDFNTGFVEQAVLIIDQMQLSWMRLESLAGNNRANILVYVKEMIEAAAAQDGMKADEYMKLAMYSGVLGISIPDDISLMPGFGNPVYAIDAMNQANPIQTELLLFNHYYGLLMRMIGVSDIMLGGGVDERKGLGVAEMEMRSTIAALHDIINGMNMLATNAVRPAVGFVIAAVSEGGQKEQYWRNVLGDMTVDSIKRIAVDEFSYDGNSLVLEGIGIGILPYPDPMEVARLNSLIQAAATSSDGKAPIIDTSQVMTLSGYMRDGRVNKAANYLAACERKRKAEAKADTEAERKFQMEMADKNAQAMMAAEQQKMAGKTEADLAKIQAGDEGRSKLQAQVDESKLTAIQAQAQAQAGVNAQMAAMNETLTQMKAVLDRQSKLDQIRLKGEEDRRTAEVVAEANEELMEKKSKSESE